MISYLKSLWNPPSLLSFDNDLSRERLIQGGRIVVIDDEEPLLIEELIKEGFSVHHDTTGDDLHNIDNQIYDVAILDYHGIGQRLGNAHGLELLKYIRRVSPRTRIIAYTSRSLNAAESEFFRLSHAVLPKDMGLGDSLALIEGELKNAFSKEHLFEALILKLDLADQKEKVRLRGVLAKALAGKNENKFRECIISLGGKAGEKAVELIIKNIFQS